MYSFIRFGTRFAAAALGAAIAAGQVLALDPMRDDPLRPYNGPTVGGPSEAFRGFQRDIERAPSLTERFGLPRVSGPIPSILPPVPTQPVFDTPDNAWPPAIERARRPGRDG
jgi:hypothetical protein